RRIGVALSGSSDAALRRQIERGEQAGMQAGWMTTGGARLDSITTFAAAAGRTVMYLSPGDKYHRLTRRLSQGQKGLDERALMASQRPFHPSGHPSSRPCGHTTPRPLTATRRSLSCALFLIPPLAAAT